MPDNPTGLAAEFYTHLKPRPALSDDEYLMRCTFCRTVTAWKLVAVVRGVAFYQCQRCGQERK